MQNWFVVGLHVNKALMPTFEPHPSRQKYEESR